jgi:hypothetical protein
MARSTRASSRQGVGDDIGEEGWLVPEGEPRSEPRCVGTGWEVAAGA